VRRRGRAVSGGPWAHFAEGGPEGDPAEGFAGHQVDGGSEPEKRTHGIAATKPNLVSF
jgi:hypothetical protein